MTKKVLLFLLFLTFLTIGVFPYTNRIGFIIGIDPISALFLMGRESHLNKLYDEDIIISESTLNNRGEKVEHKISVRNEEFGRSYVAFEFDYVSNRFFNRIQYWLFLNNDRKEFVNKVIDLRSSIVSELTKFDLGDIAEDRIDSVKCVCKRFVSGIDDKALLMNSNIDGVAAFLGPGKKSPPLLVIDDLNFASDYLDFSLCFPLETNILQPHKDYVLRDLDLTRLNRSATFIGNYSLSHYNWARIYFRNTENEIPFPWIEFYYDNPFSLSNDRKWVSKIFYEVID